MARGTEDDDASGDRRPGGIEAVRGAFLRRETTVTAHVESVLAAIRRVDPELHAYVCVAEDRALDEAVAADRLADRLGPEAWRARPLLGVTVSVKDLIQTADLPTRRGSLLPNRRPAVDAPAVARLRAAGAIVIGKTATSEYGWCGSTVSRVGPPTRNPWDPTRSAGGSSGGAAAAVAAGLCEVALGTDGAGSVRIPASFCGVAGFKPSFGGIPYVPPCADRLAHLGPITASVRDAIELMPLLAGPHRDDPDSAPRVVPRAAVPDGPLRIGWLEFPGTAAAVGEAGDTARRALESLGHRVEDLAVPFPDPGPALVDLLAAGEAAGTRPEDEQWCDPGRLAVVRYGRTVSGAAVSRAEEVRLELRQRLAAVMETWDLLAMPTVPVPPFDVDAIGPDWAADPEDLAWIAWTPATYPFNLTGQPAVSVPAGTTPSGLPVGMQLVGPVGGDDAVLAVASRWEQALPSSRVPVRVGRHDG